jgi:hypothetical protein
MLGQTLRSLLAAALAIAAGGCTSGETDSTTGDPSLQPINITLSLVDPSPDCAKVFGVPDTVHPFVLPIQVKVEGAGASKFVLRPPGYCRFGGLTQCGHLVAERGPFDSQQTDEQKCGKLDANASASSTIQRSSTTVIEMPLPALGDVSVVVRACSDADDKLLAESQVITVSTCPASSSSDGDAGADGG